MSWDAVMKLNIEVYSTVWCGDCHRLKALLKKNAIEFTDVDIEKVPEAAKELMDATGKAAIPFIKIDGQFYRGWHSEVAGQWNDEIFFNELARGGALQSLTE